VCRGAFVANSRAGSLPISAVVATWLLVLQLHLFLEGKARMAVAAAVEGARLRLEDARCSALLTEFGDADGRPLTATLESTGQTAADYLAGVYFVAGDERRCRADEATTAFTAPGSRVVHICVDRFAERFALKTRDGELLILHELLHTLGLTENPPSSAAISNVVRERCGP
jgi:hypothetical protein